MEIVNKLWLMSLQASILILVVLVVRQLLQKYPKIYSYCLWGMVGLRLLCPFWVEAPGDVAFDIFPSTVLLEDTEENSNVGDVLLNVEQEKNEVLQTSQQVVENNQSSFVDKQEVLNNSELQNTIQKVFTMVYLLGIIVFATVYFIQYLIMKKRVSTAVKGKGNVWFSENIDTPFVMGIFQPQIYLPYGLDKECGRYILKHERTHIKHFDPVIRVVGSICLCLHWWNPLVWLAVHLMNQDMEMACDEGFLLRAPMAERKAYANVLLTFAEKRNGLWVGIAFGESHTEQRVKNILLKKKKGKLALAVLIITLLLGGCAFVSSSSNTEDNSLGNSENYVENTESEAQDGVSIPTDPTGEQNNDTSYVPDIYGKWIITDWIMPTGVYALTNEEIENIIGRELNFTEDSIAEYTMQVVTGEQLQQDYGMSASALGVEGKQLEYYSLGWEHNDVFGAHFYLIDKDSALVYFEGVFFQAEREI